MASYLIQRLIAFVPTLFAISLLVFLMVFLVPGDPAQILLGPDATPENVARLREALGLDDPFIVRMTDWYGNLLQGDLGQSFTFNRSVTQAVMERLPVTLILTAFALLIAIVIGVSAGVAAAVRQNTWVDAAVMVGSLLGVSVPSFLLGLLLIYYVSLPLEWFPTGGYVSPLQSPVDSFRHLILPAFSLGFTQASLIARITRSSMLEVLRLDYVRTARSKGLREHRVIYRHALKNSLVPIITSVGIVAGVLLGGAVVTESVFSIPGVGRLVIVAIQRRDFPVIQGVILAITTSYLLVNLITDLLYTAVNPRIRYS